MTTNAQQQQQQRVRAEETQHEPLHQLGENKGHNSHMDKPEQQQDQHQPLQHPQDTSSSNSTHVGTVNRADCSLCVQGGIEQALQVQHCSICNVVELVTETCTSEETDQLEQQQQPQIWPSSTPQPWSSSKTSSSPCTGYNLQRR